MLASFIQALLVMAGALCAHFSGQSGISILSVRSFAYRVFERSSVDLGTDLEGIQAGLTLWA